MFTYVVLHYMTIEMTVDCVNHLLKLSNNSNIVIVDNCSPNNSGEQLRCLYSNNSRIHVLINSENGGFAKGNNIGYTYAKQVLKSHYIVVSNNDVIINQTDFESVMSSFMEQNEVDVCGPDIITPDDIHQNPLCETTISTSALRKTIFFNRLKLLLFSIPVFLKLYIKFRMKHKVVIGSLNKPGDITDCVLHGSFIVFNREYITNEDYAFLPETYMYGEEFILYDYLKYKGYKTAICSAAQILHLGGKATAHQWGDINKIKFRFRNTTDSLSALLRLRKQYRSNGI